MGQYWSGPRSCCYGGRYDGAATAPEAGGPGVGREMGGPVCKHRTSINWVSGVTMVPSLPQRVLHPGRVVRAATTVCGLPTVQTQCPVWGQELRRKGREQGLTLRPQLPSRWCRRGWWRSCMKI